MRIESFGGVLPEREETNEELERELSLEPGWVFARTGFRVRHQAAAGVALSDLAVQAGASALAGRQSSAPISLLLLATSTPDHHTPPTAPLVASRLELTNCGAIDLNGACAGFLYALVLGWSLGRASNSGVLVVAGNVLSRRLSRTDRRTRAVFADGAGAVLLAPSDRDELLSFVTTSCGSAYDAIGSIAGGSRTPLTPEGVDRGDHLIQIRDGKQLTRAAVDTMAAVGTACLQRASLDRRCLTWWVPHQANGHIVEQTGERLGIPADRTIAYVAAMGNSSSATIPLSLWRASRDGRLKPGDVVLMTAVGAGLTAAAALVRL